MADCVKKETARFFKTLQRVMMLMFYFCSSFLGNGLMVVPLLKNEILLQNQV